MRSRLAMLLLTLAAAVLPAASASADELVDQCRANSPSAAPCAGFPKLTERLAAECRRLGVPEDQCKLPLAHEVSQAAVDEYGKSATHRALAYQYDLGSRLPLRDTPWIGTHNSFNSTSEEPSLSHTDSNQQLSLSQQFDIDVRSVELDVHWFPSVRANGAKAPVVCHARPQSELNVGCSTERLLGDRLPEIADWLKAHRDQVVLLYLEDAIEDPAGYAETVKQLDEKLGSLIYRPASPPAAGCRQLPLDVTREQINAQGKQVVIVGDCQAGWNSDVFGWDQSHTEAGSNHNLQAFPACSSDVARSEYDSKIVRYFEDSTFIAPATAPQEAYDENDFLTPAKTRAMSDCGVDLTGFDQILPGDGRLQALAWSWADGQPSAATGPCTVQRADSRWASSACSGARRAACRGADGAWVVPAAPVKREDAASACEAAGAALALPATGEQNKRLSVASGGEETWLALGEPEPAPPADPPAGPPAPPATEPSSSEAPSSAAAGAAEPEPAASAPAPRAQTKAKVKAKKKKSKKRKRRKKRRGHR